MEKKLALLPVGQWLGDRKSLKSDIESIRAAVYNLAGPVHFVNHNGRIGISHEGTAVLGSGFDGQQDGLPLIGFAPPLHASDLGDESFKRDMGIQYAYIVGAMANGISSVEMVRAAGRNGMIGFFGAGGLALDQVARAIDQLQADADTMPIGFNLIHSPNDPQLEQAVVDLYLKHRIKLVSASAYLRLTAPLVQFRVKGIRQSQDGQIYCPNKVIAKVSRMEVARNFFAPPPQNILDQLVAQGKITSREAQLARHIPVAQDMTAEADSGGHTDNRPALALLPTILSIKDEAINTYGYKIPLRVGLAGGIATADAAAGAFSMGAAYILTGSINQSCVEADTAPVIREMLGQAQQADVTMAPAADMFELGAKVQVLKRGTMFAMRGAKLYELYRTYDEFDHIPEKIRHLVERDMLKSSFQKAWEKTRLFFQERDPSQIARAEKDSKHKMALVFRSYLGLSSIWAKTGVPERKMDYQIWCGPAMGTFNAWTKGSFLENEKERRVNVLAMNLLYGAAFLTRLHWLKSQGICLPPIHLRPLRLEQIREYLGNAPV
ncbi:MAG: PfaD family polyunsaturated fatty acid/polyketide biosynthesis protein [Desulfobacteraceae bacterium]|nr:PfaD family polyunsaturated fatty acid/polyketide biosynthesis protein [Desulfobacteraceae bacterium]